MREIPHCLSSEIVYSGYLDVRVDQLKLASSDATGSYTVILAPIIAAVILLEDEDHRLLINWEYRHPTGTYLLGLPGGKVEENEDPLFSAKRELLEETGYEAANWHLLGAHYPFPSCCSQKIYFYHATLPSTRNKPALEPLELIEPHWVSEAELQDQLEKGLPSDGILLTALYLRNIFLNKKKP